MINSYAVKKRLKELNLTQKNAAHSMNCKQSTASLKINNRRPMNLDEAWALARLLKVEDKFCDYFFSRNVA